MVPRELGFVRRMATLIGAAFVACAIVYLGGQIVVVGFQDCVAVSRPRISNGQPRWWDESSRTDAPDKCVIRSFRYHCVYQQNRSPEAASSRLSLVVYFLTASAASRAASLTSPATLCADPLALSILPSVSRSLSPLSLPAPSLMAPFALSAAPFMCSRSRLCSLL